MADLYKETKVRDWIIRVDEDLLEPSDWRQLPVELCRWMGVDTLQRLENWTPGAWPAVVRGYPKSNPLAYSEVGLEDYYVFSGFNPEQQVRNAHLLLIRGRGPSHQLTLQARDQSSASGDNGETRAKAPVQSAFPLKSAPNSASPSWVFNDTVAKEWKILFDGRHINAPFWSEFIAVLARRVGLVNLERATRLVVRGRPFIVRRPFADSSYRDVPDAWYRVLVGESAMEVVQDAYALIAACGYPREALSFEPISELARQLNEASSSQLAPPPSSFNRSVSSTITLSDSDAAHAHQAPANRQVSTARADSTGAHAKADPAPEASSTRSAKSRKRPRTIRLIEVACSFYEPSSASITRARLITNTLQAMGTLAGASEEIQAVLAHLLEHGVSSFGALAVQCHVPLHRIRKLVAAIADALGKGKHGPIMVDLTKRTVRIDPQKLPHGM